MNTHFEWGAAALAAAESASAELQYADQVALQAMLFAEPADVERFVADAIGYLAAARAAGPADLVRWGAAKGLLLLPADAYDGLSPAAKHFFDAFTFAAKGLIDGFAPAARPRPQTLAPLELPGGDELYERIESKPRPARVAAPITVTLAPAIAQAPAWTPTREQFQAMTPEERRGFAGAYGFPALLDEIAAGKPLITSIAPEGAPVIGPEEIVKFDARVRAGEAAAAAAAAAAPPPAPPRKGGEGRSHAKRKGAAQ
jgi:hypothetical protein